MSADQDSVPQDSVPQGSVPQDSVPQDSVNQGSKEGVPVIDVDGSYLARKVQKLQDSGVNTAPLEPPSNSPAGWEVVSADNYKDFADKIPQMMPGTFTKHAVATSVIYKLNYIFTSPFRYCIHIPSTYVGRHSDNERACQGGTLTGHQEELNKLR